MNDFIKGRKLTDEESFLLYELPRINILNRQSNIDEVIKPYIITDREKIQVNDSSLFITSKKQEVD